MPEPAGHGDPAAAIIPLPPTPPADRPGSFRFARRHPLRVLALVALLALIGLATVAAGIFLWSDWQLRGARRAVALGHNAEAVRYLTAVRRFRPDEPEVLLLSARVARRSGGWNEAELLLDRY